MYRTIHYKNKASHKGGENFTLKNSLGYILLNLTWGGRKSLTIQFGIVWGGIHSMTGVDDLKFLCIFEVLNCLWNSRIKYSPDVRQPVKRLLVLTYDTVRHKTVDEVTCGSRVQRCPTVGQSEPQLEVSERTTVDVSGDCSPLECTAGSRDDATSSVEEDSWRT